MIRWDADVVVVGGGPAGAASAAFLARGGFHVLLLDKQSFPRSKPCGDCMSPPAALVFEELGVLGAVIAAKPASLDGWRVFSPDGAAFTGVFGEASGDRRLQSALALRRDLLDHVLILAAEQAGVVVRTGARVTDVVRDTAGRVAGVSGRAAGGEPFIAGARFVIGADGLRSIVARRLRLVRRGSRLRKASCSVRLSGFSGADSFGELHIGQRACAGFAPISAPDAAGTREVNLTVVVPSGEAHGTGGARALLWRAARGLPTLRPHLDQLLALDAAQQPPVLASGPFDRPTRDVVVPGAALAGDAAGYFDPFTGQGIYHALVGARMLASAVTDALSGRHRRGERDPLAEYARQHRRMIREAELLQRLIDWAVRHPTVAHLAVRRLAHAPAAANALVAATGDLRRARSLLLPRVLLTLLDPHRDRSRA